MEKSQVLKQFWKLIYEPIEVRSLNEIRLHMPSNEELQLLEDIYKLPKEKQELWETAFKVIWEFETPQNSFLHN